jgi:hypothetical protein
MPMHKYIVTSTFGGALTQFSQVPWSGLGNMPAKVASKDVVKAVQLRVWKALLLLLISMTGGAILLMTLGDNPPSGGAFCLSSYYKLASADQAVASRAMQAMGRWRRIEVCYSGTRGGNIESLAWLQGLTQLQDLECHFVICNGLGGEDGLILTTDRWEDQQFVHSSLNGYGPDETIRICLVSDGRYIYPTDCQVKRVESLVDTLCRRFSINAESVYYPADMVATQAR